jgi:hypothetical protein
MPPLAHPAALLPASAFGSAPWADLGRRDGRAPIAPQSRVVSTQRLR